MKPTIARILLAAGGLLFLPLACLLATLKLTTNTNSVSIPFATTDYNSATGAAQIIKTSAQTLTIVSDTNTWTLNVKASTSTFSFVPSSGDSNPNKPASDLAVRVPAFTSTWTSLSTSNQVIATGPKQSGNQTRAVDHRLNSNLSTDPPGTYTISIVFTISQP